MFTNCTRSTKFKILTFGFHYNSRRLYMTGKKYYSLHAQSHFIYVKDVKGRNISECLYMVPLPSSNISSAVVCHFDLSLEKTLWSISLPNMFCQVCCWSFKLGFSFYRQASSILVSRICFQFLLRDFTSLFYDMNRSVKRSVTFFKHSNFSFLGELSFLF